MGNTPNGLWYVDPNELPDLSWIGQQMQNSVEAWLTRPFESVPLTLGASVAAPAGWRIDCTAHRTGSLAHVIGRAVAVAGASAGQGQYMLTLPWPAKAGTWIAGSSAGTANANPDPAQYAPSPLTPYFLAAGMIAFAQSGGGADAILSSAGPVIAGSARPWAIGAANPGLITWNLCYETA